MLKQNDEITFSVSGAPQINENIETCLKAFCERHNSRFIMKIWIRVKWTVVSDLLSLDGIHFIPRRCVSVAQRSTSYAHRHCNLWHSDRKEWNWDKEGHRLSCVSAGRAVVQWLEGHPCCLHVKLSLSEIPNAKLLPPLCHWYASACAWMLTADEEVALAGWSLSPVYECLYQQVNTGV